MNRNENISKSAINGAIWMFIGSVLQIIIQIALIAVLAHMLTPADFGVVSLILIFANFAYLFTTGVAISLIQVKELTRDHISLGYSVSVLIGVVFCGLFYFLADPISRFFDVHNLLDALQFFAFFLPIKGFNSVSEAILRRRMKFAITVRCSVISYIFGFGIASVVFAWYGFGFWSLIYGQLSQLVLYTILLLFYERPVFTGKINRSVAKEITSFGTGYTLSDMFNFFAENADNTIAGKLLGVSALGIYSRAFQLLSIPSSFFGTIFDNVLLPVLSSRQSDKEKLSNFYLFSLAFCFVILLPLSVFLVVNADFIINILLGPKWSQTVPAFQVLILALSFRFGTRINKSFITSLGYVYKGAYYQVVFAAMVIVFCYFGSKRFGIIGLAGGVLLSSVVHYFHTASKLIKVFNFSLKDYVWVHLKTILAALPLVLVLTLTFFVPVFSSMYVALVLSLAVLFLIYMSLLHSRNTILFNSNNNPFIFQIIENLPGSFGGKVAGSRWMDRFKYNER